MAVQDMTGRTAPTIHSQVRSLRFAAQGFLDVILKADELLRVSAANDEAAQRTLQRTRERKKEAGLEDRRAAKRDKFPAEHNAKLARRQHDFRCKLLGASRDSAAGALLQLAKGILSVRFGERLVNAPSGRMIGSVSLKEMIWAARNQSVHWDAPPSEKNKKTRSVFALLAPKYGEAFDLERGAARSRAYDCVQLLGWTSYEQYERDVASLINAQPRQLDD